ncbi:MAG: tRNA pseudouridine(55) synthase TruB [Bacteroidia bacterium]|jgi:tRNA pseudouridine55 synthase|nr:tRNA pseudouridine(55) synthase TruB [Bacteroidia bacterium]
MTRQYDFAAGEVLLIDKPLTWTSFDVVNRVKHQITRRLKIKAKVGHAGTLDPLATGLLIICTGKFTKRLDSFQAQEKEYTGTIVIGATTPCCDLEKPIDAWYGTAHITDELLHQTAAQFTGTQTQVPPVFSAVRVNGKRAYEHARSGRETTMPPRQVEIPVFELTAIRRTTAENGHALVEVDFRVECSKGTYIRSLARDYGQALQSGAHLSALRRTKIGEFSVSGAITPEAFMEVMKEMEEEMSKQQP